METFVMMEFFGSQTGGGREEGITSVPFHYTQTDYIDWIGGAYSRLQDRIGR
jgi:hypothetical protein